MAYKVGISFFSINMFTYTIVMISYNIIIIFSVQVDEYYKLLIQEAVCATNFFRSVSAKSLHNIMMIV